MALIACPECAKEVSTEAKACPACGYPLAERGVVAATPSPEAQASAMNAVDTQTVLLEVRPFWWNFFWHLLFCWLLVPLFIALYLPAPPVTVHVPSAPEFRGQSAIGVNTP